MPELLALVPPTARVVRDGRDAEVPIEQVRVNRPLRVRRGESIPADGLVAEMLPMMLLSTCRS